MPVTATFHSSMTQQKPTSPSGAISRQISPKTRSNWPMDQGAETNVTAAEFSKWKVELKAKAIVAQEVHGW